MSVTMIRVVGNFVETIPIQLPNKTFIFGMPEMVAQNFLEFFFASNLYLGI